MYPKPPMSINTNKIIQYWGFDLSGIPRQLFKIRWNNDEFFYVDHHGQQSFKVSIHSPRKGLSRSHLKIGVKEMSGTRAFTDVPLQQNSGLKFIAGGAVKIEDLKKCNEVKERDRSNLYPFPIQSRNYYRHYLSNIQWRVYLLEQENFIALQNDTMTKVDTTALIGTYLYRHSNPWIFVQFTRNSLQVENLVFQNSPQRMKEVTLKEMIRTCRKPFLFRT